MFIKDTNSPGIKGTDLTTAYYFRGVAIGLTIAWITTALATYTVGQYRKRAKESFRLRLPLDWTLVAFELVLSVIFFILSYTMM